MLQVDGILDSANMNLKLQFEYHILDLKLYVVFTYTSIQIEKFVI